MNKHVKIIKCKRILALALALAVGVTFTPMFGGVVHAATPGETAIVDNSLGTPTNYASQYAVYWNYLDFNTSTNFMSGSKCIYMEYRVRGGTWQTSGKMTNYLTTYKIDGLRSNTNYEARVYFGYWDAKGRFYRGPYSGIINFRTGQAKKLKIKSIKVKAVKVKKHRATYYGWYTGLPLGKYKYYTYKIKVTIKLKKKPGAKGIYINGKRLKGNKKKYTVTFGKYSSYTKPRGKKFRVYAYSFNDYSCGGYSPMYSKKKKIK